MWTPEPGSTPTLAVPRLGTTHVMLPSHLGPLRQPFPFRLSHAQPQQVIICFHAV